MNFCTETTLNIDDAGIAELKPEAARAKVARYPKRTVRCCMPKKAEHHRGPADVSQGSSLLDIADPMTQIS
jgi:hypothetical protein